MQEVDRSAGPSAPAAPARARAQAAAPAPAAPSSSYRQPRSKRSRRQPPAPLPLLQEPELADEAAWQQDQQLDEGAAWLQEEQPVAEAAWEAEGMEEEGLYGAEAGYPGGHPSASGSEYAGDGMQTDSEDEAAGLEGSEQLEEDGEERQPLKLSLVVRECLACVPAAAFIQNISLASL